MSGLLVYHALAFVSPRARVLPATVASPVCVASTPADLERLEVAADFTGSGSATQSFASLGLPPTVVSNLEELLGAGALPNALQAASYSVLAGGRDAVIDAHTGSGKTLALLLPVVSQLDAAVREPQALILCPSRELAHQVARVAASLLQGTGLSACALVGGANVNRQLERLRKAQPLPPPPPPPPYPPLSCRLHAPAASSVSAALPAVSPPPSTPPTPSPPSPHPALAAAAVSRLPEISRD